MRTELNIGFQLMHAHDYPCKHFAKARMQLSFEFMVYIAVAISAIAAGLVMLMHFHSSTSSLSDEITLETFASLINNNIGQTKTFHAFIPQGLCSAMSANTINQLKTLVSASAIVVDSKSLCNKSKPFGTVELNYLPNGSIEIE